MDWVKLSKTIRERDRFTCFKCGEEDVNIHVHHIIPIKRSKNNNPDNLICLCKSCHKKADNSYNTIGMTTFVIDMLDEAYKRSNNADKKHDGEHKKNLLRHRSISANIQQGNTSN